MVSKLRRLLQHATTGRIHVARALPEAKRHAVGTAVAELESRTSAELRVVVEGSLDTLDILRGVSARQRAIHVFASERVWDTELNNGVLLYLLLAERDAEIVADRGLNGKISDEEWSEVTRALEQRVSTDGLVPALVATIEHISSLLQRVFPSAHGRGELPDELIVR
jgi:uncharacterized membrane protein